MANQQLIDWIKSQKAQGYSEQQLYNSLVQQGYNSNEVNEAIKITSQPNQQINQSSEPIKSFNLLPVLIIGAIIIILIGGSIFYFTSQDKNIDSDTQVNSDDLLTDKEAEQLVEGGQKNEPSGNELSGCDAFPDRLDACEPFSCEFEHPFDENLMKKEIKGYIGKKCHYLEEMPNDSKMECLYSLDTRKAIAQYHRDIASAKTIGTSIKAASGNKDVETTYTIDGEQVENPLQEAMDSEQCVFINETYDQDKFFLKNLQLSDVECHGIKPCPEGKICVHYSCLKLQDIQEISKCKEAVEIFEEYNCIKTVAIKKLDATLCKEIGNQPLLKDTNACYLEIAIAKNDISICDPLVNMRLEYLKTNQFIIEPYKCYTEFAIAKSDESYCDRIKEKENREKCIRQVHAEN